MADSLGVQFFVGAKAQYESTSKWRLVIVALLAYLHVGLVIPFATVTRDKAEIDRQLVENRLAEKEMKLVLDAADNLANLVSDANNRVATELKEELVDRFKRLSKTVDVLIRLGPAQAEGDEGAAVFRNRPPQAVTRNFPMMQRSLTPEERLVASPMPTSARGLAPMSPSLRKMIAEGGYPGSLLQQKLRDYIKSSLIPPAFNNANAAWARTRSTIAQTGSAIVKNIVDSKVAAPADVAAELDRLDNSVKALLRKAQDLKFVPPSNDTWWQTVQGKGASIREMTSDFAKSVGNFETRQMALKGLATQISEIAVVKKQAAAKLNDELAKLKEQADALQSQLGHVAAPLKVVSFKLAQIAPFLPLIIAVTLAAIGGWSAQGLRRMTIAAQLVGDGADATAIRGWLHTTAGGSRAWVAGIQLAVAIACIAWVVAAAWSIGSLSTPFLTHSVLVAISVAVVVAARAYHWRIADAAVSAGTT